jgi:ATP-binding cassette, subfamily F, member 3
MNLLQLQNAHKAYGSRVLFDQETFAINDGEHVGVIGPNGAGKTTLFRTIVGEEELDSGEIIRSNALRLGYLAQEDDWNLEETGEEFLAENCTLPLWQLKDLGLGLGLKPHHFSEPLKKLSGGYRMRFQLLFLIGREPNLMLLDEPTNFLDLESLMALEKFLQAYAGAFMLISHDREFLRRVTDHTLEVEGTEITKYPGNIDDYFEQKAQLRLILERQAANQELKKKSIEDFVRKFGAKATKARQAQSRMKQLEKMENIELKELPVRARIQIPSPSPVGKEIFHLKEARMGYGTTEIVSVKNLRLERGDHLGIVGFNGVGKSTLLKSLSGKIPFLAGDLKWGYQVKVAAFAQHSTESLDSSHTVLRALQEMAHHEVTQQEILNMAGSLLFSGDAVKKSISVLSGGEKSRVALGQILLSKANVLLLDEPTNHLDFETVEALTHALHSYQGSLLIVSHDRGFIGRVANKILEIHNKKLELYPGTYDDYCWSLERGALSQRSSWQDPSIEVLAVESVASTSAPKVNLKEERKKLENKLAQTRKQMRHLEIQIAEQQKLRDEFTDQLLKVSGEKAIHASKQLAETSRQIEKLEEGLFLQLEAESESTHELEKINSQAGLT